MRFSFLMSISKVREFTNQSINSVLNQNYTSNYEIIIINDGIEVNSFQHYIETNFSNHKNFKFLKIYSNKENLGLTKSLNIGLNICSGDYIVRIDDDDVSNNNRLEELAFILNQNINMKIITSSYELIDKNNQVKKKIKLSKEKFFKKYKFKNILAHSSLCFDKIFIQKIGGYNEEFQTSQDYEIINRAIKFDKNAIFFLNKNLVQIRIHDNSISKLKSYSQRTNSIKICLASKFTKYYELIINSDFKNLEKVIDEINEKNMREYLNALIFCYLYDKSDSVKINSFAQFKFVIQIYFYNYQIFFKKILSKF